MDQVVPTTLWLGLGFRLSDFFSFGHRRFRLFKNQHPIQKRDFHALSLLSMIPPCPALFQ